MAKSCDDFSRKPEKGYSTIKMSYFVGIRGKFMGPGLSRNRAEQLKKNSRNWVW
jgi:hypothetical protein